MLHSASAPTVVFLADPELNDLVTEVRERGLAIVARELGVPRQTLGMVLLGTARKGSTALVLAGLRARSERNHPEARHG